MGFLMFPPAAQTGRQSHITCLRCCKLQLVIFEQKTIKAIICPLKNGIKKSSPTSQSVFFFYWRQLAYWGGNRLNRFVKIDLGRESCMVPTCTGPGS